DDGLHAGDPRPRDRDGRPAPPDDADGAGEAHGQPSQHSLAAGTTRRLGTHFRGFRVPPPGLRHSALGRRPPDRQAAAPCQGRRRAPRMGGYGRLGGPPCPPALSVLALSTTAWVTFVRYAMHSLK